MAWRGVAPVSLHLVAMVLEDSSYDGAAVVPPDRRSRMVHINSDLDISSISSLGQETQALLPMQYLSVPVTRYGGYGSFSEAGQ